MMIKHILSAADRRLAAEIGAERDRRDREARVKDRRVTPHKSSRDVNIEGVYGELAFCRYWGTTPDLSTEPRRGTPDTVMRNGSRVDVKSTDVERGRLLCKLDKDDKYDVDCYVLALLHALPAVYLFGYAARDALIAPHNITDLGRGPTYALKQRDKRVIQLFDGPEPNWPRRMTPEDMAAWVAQYDAVIERDWKERESA